MVRNKKVLIILSTLVLVFLLWVTFHVVNIVGNYRDRCAVANEEFQREFLSKYMEDDVIKLEQFLSFDIYYITYKRSNYCRLRMENETIGEKYLVEYDDGKIKETPNIGYASLFSNINDYEEFADEIFTAELDFTDCEMEFIFENDLSEEQEEMLVRCKLKGEKQLTLNFKYCDKVIIINDVIVEYGYIFNEVHQQLYMRLKMVYNGQEAIDYTMTSKQK